MVVTVGTGVGGGLHGGFCWKSQRDAEARDARSPSSLPSPNEIAVRCPAPLGSEPPPGPENPLPRPPSRLGFLELRSVILGTQKRRQKDKDYK